MAEEFNLFDKMGNELQLGMNDVVQGAALQGKAHIQQHIIANGQVDTGFMLNSVEAVNTGEQTAEIRVGADYAGYQNYGTRFIPPRPFFEPGIDDAQADLDGLMSTLVVKRVEGIQP